MAEERDIPNGGFAASSASDRTRSTAAAVARVAELAERMAGDAPEGERLDALRDAQAAAVLAEEAVALCEADPVVAKAVADEAMSMVSRALTVLQEKPKGVPPTAAEEASRVEGSHATADRPTLPVAPAPASRAQAADAPVQEKDEPLAAAQAQEEGEPVSTPKAAPAHAKRSHAARNTFFVLVAVLLAVAGLALAAWLGAFRLPEPLQSRIDLLPDAHAQAGRLNAGDADVAPGSFRLVLNQVCTLEPGSLDCPIAFENPQANGYSARLDLAVDGEWAAGSGIVEPGYRLDALRLNRTLAPGEHKATATVSVYSGATQVNTLSADIVVRAK